MSIFVFGCGKAEIPYFEACRDMFALTIHTTAHSASVETAYLAKGHSCISVLSTRLSKETIEALYANGVSFISTRTVGYDHIDLEACQQLGIHVANVNYSPESVCDYTIMLMLMTLRKMKLIMKSVELQDYSFEKVYGRNLKNRVVGVIGMGAIGATLIHHLYGFGCKIIAYTPHPKTALQGLVDFVTLDELYRNSDVISLHVPLCVETQHMINASTIEKMKDGVILINTARGGLIDNEALIRGIETGKIAGAALDVVEGESGIYYNNKKGMITKQRAMSILQSFPNVIMSPHMAFLTGESTNDMVRNSIQSCYAFLNDEDDDFRIV